MTISVGLWGGKNGQLDTIRKEIAPLPSLSVRELPGYLVQLATETALPTVLVLGLPKIQRRHSGASLYGFLSTMEAWHPTVRIAVWTDALEEGAALDLTRAGVLGIVLWKDAHPSLWPLVVRSVYARTQIWSRPFDLRPLPNPVSDARATETIPVSAPRQCLGAE